MNLNPYVLNFVGVNKNVELLPKTPASTYLQIFSEALLKVAASYKPELVVISAGFDAHLRDPAANQCLEEKDFSEMTRILIKTVSPHTNLLLSLLEGGYNVISLRDSVRAHCDSMMSTP